MFQPGFGGRMGMEQKQFFGGMLDSFILHLSLYWNAIETK